MGAVSGLLGQITDKAANLLRIAVSNSDRLVRLINDILDLERMESGRAPLNFRATFLNELAQQVVDAMQPMADAASIRLVVKWEITPVEADPDRLVQVVTNLLSNAIKFSQPDSTVSVEVAPVDGGAQLSCYRRGRGIPTDKLESIFDRFQQVDASDSRQKGGTGLGLAICRTIVQQHGGRIWAEHNPFGGLRSASFCRSGQAWMTARTSNFMPDSFTKEDTILICEGDAAARKQFVETLRKRNYRILEAENREQAIHLAQQFSLGAILLGVSQQRRDGLMTLRALREEPSIAQVPIVVLSLLSPDDRSPEAQVADSWLRLRSTRLCFWPSWRVWSKDHASIRRFCLSRMTSTWRASFSPPLSATGSLSTMLPGCRMRSSCVSRLDPTSSSLTWLYRTAMDWS